MWNSSHARATPASAAPRTAAASPTTSGVTRSDPAGTRIMILTARRRMIAHYNGVKDVPRPRPTASTSCRRWKATPRVAPSGPGDDRSGGARRHAGPRHRRRRSASRCAPIADGVVIFAGINMPDQVAHEPHPAREDHPLRLAPAWASAASTCASSTRPSPSASSPATCTSTATTSPSASRCKAGQVIGAARPHRRQGVAAAPALRGPRRRPPHEPGRRWATCDPAQADDPDLRPRPEGQTPQTPPRLARQAAFARPRLARRSSPVPVRCRANDPQTGRARLPPHWPPGEDSRSSRPNLWSPSATSRSPTHPASPSPASRSRRTPSSPGTTPPAATWSRSSPTAPRCSASATSARWPASR